MFLVATLSNALWIVLFIVFGINIYVWSKGKINNKTVAIIVAIFIVYLLFMREPSVVWIVAVALVINWVYGKDLKKLGSIFQID